MVPGVYVIKLDRNFLFPEEEKNERETNGSKNVRSKKNLPKFWFFENFKMLISPENLKNEKTLNRSQNA